MPITGYYPGEVNIILWINGQLVVLTVEQFEKVAKSVHEALTSGGQTIQIDFGTNPVTFMYSADPIEAMLVPKGTD